MATPRSAATAAAPSISRLSQRRMLREKRAGAHDDAGRAVAALEPVLGPEGLLDRMQPLSGRDALDGRDLPAVDLNRQHETGANRRAVEEHGAGAAHAVLAPDMRPREIEIFAKEISQGRAHVHIPRVGRAVDGDANGPLHAAFPRRSSAAASTGEGRVPATVERYSAVACRSPSGRSAAAAAFAASPMRAGVGCRPRRADS